VARASAEAAHELEADLRRAVAGEVRFDPYSRALYSTDASIYQIEPIGVVIPRNRDDVQAALEVARRHGAPILPRGSGSSLAGQAVGAAVVLDFSKYLNRIVDIDPGARRVRAEPGVVCDALNAALAQHGLMYGPEPASSNRATVGGMLANNATGAHSILYGMAADQVLAVEALLADGTPASLGALGPVALEARCAEPGRLGDLYRGLRALVSRHADVIKERFPKTWRRASGYGLNYLLPPHGYTATQPPVWASAEPYPPATGFNVARLLAGSEGTLAVVTEATLQVTPRPKATGLCVLAFESIAAAADATPACLECRPAAVELIDAMLIGLARAAPGFARRLTFLQPAQVRDGDPPALLAVEFFDQDQAGVIQQIERLEAHLARRRVRLRGTPMHALTPGEQADVWAVRKVGLGLIMSMRGASKPTPFMEDVAVPVERLGEYVRAVQGLFAEQHLEAAFYAHASAGCLHIRPVLNLKRADDVARMRTMAGAVLDLVIGMGGAMSGEHGDGLSRSAFNGRLFGPDLYAAFVEVKRLFDPEQRLNPGKVVEAQQLTENLRYGPDYRTLKLDTHLSFAREGGFAAAVEQCNGSAVCRKADGTMCPSYMATLEEEHSTRGRANALRAALAGRLPPAALTSERMHAVLDLCLECKACKTECPSGVDMAKIKYEFLAHYQAVHGVPLRSRLFANLHLVSQLARPLAPIVNPVLGSGLARGLGAKTLGLARQRRLPAFARRSFRQWFRGYSQPIDMAHAAPVVLLVDTYTEFNEPEIGQAAVRLLNAAGRRVIVTGHGCCGRPMISKGLLHQARAAAGRLVKALAPYASQGTPIVGLEPSCLLTLRDEYLDLLPGSAPAAEVASQAVLVEEYLTHLADQGDLPLAWKPVADRRVLVHGHCYQKALPGTQPLLRMLRLPGWEVREIDSGCCGMAGAFGYEQEHYALSQAIGEARLFPAVRAAPADTLLAASGTSCRHQIEHGAGRRARHPVELLAGALA
jgi:FAD/FMN-containing dehydrogenase/Fe-S oxidoreductase